MHMQNEDELATSDLHPGTLQVKERAGVRGLLRGRLGDGPQERAVAFQNGRHEAQEGLLDLQLQRLEALPTAQLRGGAHAELQLPVAALLTCRRIKVITSAGSP